MHYYQFNIADYRKDTTHLTPIEHYIYRTLIDWYYLDEQPIPTETQVVLRRLGLGNEYMVNLTNVLADFFKNTPKGYIHSRIDVDIDAYHRQSEKNRVNGMRGGRPRKTQSVLVANPVESQKKPNHKPITINHKPITILPTQTYMSKSDADFDDFWREYPKKVGKDAARKAWEKAKPNIGLVLTALEWQKQSAQWFKNDGQFIPNPATYINQGRWMDEPTQSIGF